MYVRLIVLSWLFCMAIGSSAQTVEKENLKATGSTGRTVYNFNRDWKFQLADIADGEAPGLDDSQWQQVGLPHSFSMPYFLSPDFYTGYGWYRKHFSLDGSYKNRKVFLEFEGVFQEAEVFVNGKKIGEHIGGYTGFSIDISEALQQGDNLVAVRVNNLWKPGLAPRAGEHVFSGGIYRDVYLVATNRVHIDWCGTFITTPQVSESRATVQVQTTIRNEAAQSNSIRVQTTILDPRGRRVRSMTTEKNIQPGKVYTITQVSAPILQPRLWHPDHPFLYTAVTSIYKGTQKIDEQKNVFGIRSIEWTADKGFFLNGKHLYLRGANVHQDHAGWGDAVTNAGFYRDVKLMKEAGFNFIRGSHYPHDPAFAEACDRLGMLFWSESNFWGIGGSDRTPEGYWNASAYPTKSEDTAAFHASIRRHLQEMIRIHRNHPSIIAWSLSNEPFFTSRQTIVPMRALLKQLVSVSHREDPTRPAAIGGAQRPLDSLRIDLLGDVAGYNGDGGTIAVFQNPGVANIVSEYGSTTSDRPGQYEPGWGDLARDSGKAKHPWRSGQAIWCGFDHGSIAGAKLGKMGIIDYFRIPKRAWYWYRNEYAGVPPPAWPQPGIPAALRLEADKTTAATDGTDDVHLLLTVLDANGRPVSNSPDVELTVVSGPGEFPTGSSINFSEKSDIRIQDGRAAIEYRSWYAGTSVVRASAPGLAPATIEIDFTGQFPYRQGISPRMVDRPYTRFINKKLPTVAQTFGRNNPAFASSSAAHHLAGHAADGVKNTWWQPAAGDANPYWILDTEKRLALTDVHIVFPVEGIYRYRVEVSEDRQNWKLLADCTGNDQKETVKKLKLNDVVGGSIRITFDKAAQAALAEVEVTGKVLE